MKKKVLFICTHNSARSQIAEGLMNALYRTKYEAYSAGTEPTQVNPYAIKVMKEINIDISQQHSKNIEKFRQIPFDYVITVCDRAKETCSYFPEGKIQLHKDFEDPSEYLDTTDKVMEKFRRTRNEIKDWIIDNFDQEA